MPISVDSSKLPLLRIRYDGSFSDDELRDYLGVLDGVLKVAGKKVAIIDLRTAAAASANQRRLQAEWIKRNVDRLKTSFRGAAIITDSALMRGIVTAIFWIHPLPFPTEVVPDLASAQDWVKPHLHAAG